MQSQSVNASTDEADIRFVKCATIYKHVKVVQSFVNVQFSDSYTNNFVLDMASEIRYFINPVCQVLLLIKELMLMVQARNLFSCK